MSAIFFRKKWVILEKCVQRSQMEEQLCWLAANARN